MVKTVLQVEKGQNYIAVNVEGIPLGRYAPQILHLLSQYGLDAIKGSLAQPIFTHHGLASQWLSPVSSQPITPWREATLPQQVSCLATLIEMAKAIESLRRELSQHDNRSLTIIDQVLKNLTVIPSTDAIFLVNQQPLLLYWGYYSQDRHAVDFYHLHNRLQQTLGEESSPAQPDTTVLPRLAHHKTSRIYYTAAALGALSIAGTLCFNAMQPTKIVPTPPAQEFVAPADEVKLTLKALTAATQALPIQAAEYIAPPPRVKPVVMKKIRVPIMIPERSRYQGNTDFLDGTWHANLKVNTKIVIITYRFKHGQASTTVKNGQQHCVTTSQAAFTAAGQLFINTAKTHCNDSSMLPAITLVCEKSAPNTQCIWKQNPSTTLPVVLYSEGK